MNISDVSVAGVSRSFDGEMKFRCAMTMNYAKTLARNGHTEIDFIELPGVMSKLEATNYLLEINFDDGNEEVRACIQEANLKYKLKEAQEARRKPRAVKQVVADVVEEVVDVQPVEMTPEQFA